MQCNYCERQFENKELLVNHLSIHTDEKKQKKKQFICKLCKMEFEKEVQLKAHISNIHSRKRKFKMKRYSKKQHYKHKCAACHNKFKYDCQLKYHIRKNHFNLIGQVPYCNVQGINQVWFEKVLKTDIIVEIKKMADNLLIIRKLNENTSIKPTEMEREIIDVRLKYPLNSSSRLLVCRVCSKLFNRKQLVNHFMEKHGQLFKKSCDACNARFKRLINCAIHNCPVSSVNLYPD